MPTYEYRCPSGHEFEFFYRTMSSAQSELKCPVCGAVGQRKVSGGSVLVFKGSGFYITDYGKDGKKDQRQAPPKSEGSKGTGGESGGGSSGAGSDQSSKGSDQSSKGSDKSSKGSEKPSKGSEKPSKGSGSSE